MKKKDWFKGRSNKNSREFIDIDYAHKLTKKDREWLANFLDGEYHANRKAAQKIRKRKLTKEEKRELDAANNRRRRDAHNFIDRSKTADQALLNSETVLETLDQTSEEYEE